MLHVDLKHLLKISKSFYIILNIIMHIIFIRLRIFQNSFSNSQQASSMLGPLCKNFERGLLSSKLKISTDAYKSHKYEEHLRYFEKIF